jgi:hypothetical protein
MDKMEYVIRRTEINNQETIMNDLGKFTRGRVVIAPSVYPGYTPDECDPGHVVGFSKVHDDILVRVEFADGKIKDIFPKDLVLI